MKRNIDEVIKMLENFYIIISQEQMAYYHIVINDDMLNNTVIDKLNEMHIEYYVTISKGTYIEIAVRNW